MDIKRAASASLLAAFAYTAIFQQSIVRGLELTNLLFYMDVWPSFIAAAGYSAAYLTSSYLRFSFNSRKLTFTGFTLSAALITYWHLPANSFFGYGVCPADLNNPLLYMLKRVSYFTVGVALYFSVRSISKPWREALAIAFGKVMGWYGMYLTLVQTPLYAAPPVIFSTQLHHETGFAMLLTMVFLDFIAVSSLVNHYFRDKKTTPYPLITGKT
ncbi:MAG: hypothetical protein RMK31_06885 [Candidatus Caldarchaeum sp.]|nr:hypothetical protein [Candidatus Caldarchaeum sp.]MDW8360288.1 hypothetical protein [Candidatus Caldarchaeum sp.]